MAIVGALAPKGMSPLWYLGLKRTYFLGAFVAVWVWARPRHHSRRGMIPILPLVPALIVWNGVVHLAGVLALPDPFIDTWAWTQASLRALAAGIHPYTVPATALAHASDWVGETASTYPYMPMTLVAFYPPFLLFGDYRYLGAILAPITVLLVRTVGRRLAVDMAMVDAASFVVLLYPRQFWVTANGYIEPLMGFCLACFAVLTLKWPGSVAAATAFLAIPALKQYCLVPLVLFALMAERTTWRTLAIAGVVLSATMVPFLYWDAGATVTGIVTQMITPEAPRLDATSLVALFATLDLGYATRWLSVGAQVAVGALAYARLRDTGAGGLLLGSAMSLLVTFLAGWQAFDNYFSFVSLMLVVSALFLASRRLHAF